jgi:hypothetical protein
MNATKVLCEVCETNPASITVKFGNPVLGGTIPVCSECAGYDPNLGGPLDQEAVTGRIVNRLRLRAKAGMIDMKYFYAPCVDCFKALPASEQIQYAPNWTDNGICPKCRHLYCGNPSCRRVLRRKDIEDYVAVINQDSGDMTMTCEYCHAEHLYFGGRDVHLMGFRLPGKTEWGHH